MTAEKETISVDEQEQLLGELGLEIISAIIRWSAKNRLDYREPTFRPVLKMVMEEVVNTMPTHDEGQVVTDQLKV